MYYKVFPAALSNRPAVTKKVASNVNGLTFTTNNWDPALATEVSTDLTLQENVNNLSQSITLSTKSRLRNY